MKPAKIAIVDDHKIVRDGIKILLSDDPDLQVSFEAENGSQAVELAGVHNPDLIIMDITMEGMDGIEATSQIKKHHPDIKILALTMLSEDQHIRKMIKAGASGYILKSSGKHELYQAIEALLNDQHYFSDGATQAILSELVSPELPKKKSSADVHITEREMEVLKLIVNEFTNQEIAEKLFLSVRTVDAHRRNLLQKTGSKNTAGLVKFAFQNNVFNDEEE